MNATLGAHVHEWAPSTGTCSVIIKKENIKSFPAFTQPSQSFFTCFHSDVVVLLVARLRRAAGALWTASKGHLVSRTQTDVHLQLNIAPPFVVCSLLVSRESSCKNKNSEAFDHFWL